MRKADDKELEEAINYFRKRMDICLENAEICDENDFDEEETCLRKEQILIETILKELKRLQEENSKLERANKTYINSIQNITPVLLEDYIEKDKIREKIEERKFKLQQEYRNFEDDIKLNILEELLERK